MTPIVAFGDWHGNTVCALQVLEHALDNYPGAHLVHVGDFGFWDTQIRTNNGLRGFVAKINNLLSRYNATLHVVLGNHENYWAIPDVYGFKGLYNTDDLGDREKYPVGDVGINQSITSTLYVSGDDIDDERKYLYLTEQGYLQSYVFPNILIVPRGFVCDVGGRTIAYLGGGGSVDAQLRVRGRDWWEEEAVSSEQVDRFLAAVDHHHKDVDVMVVHDLPRCVVEDITQGWGELNLHRDVERYTTDIENNIERAVRHVNPSLLIGGHMHTRYSGVMDNGTAVEVLNCDGKPMKENFFVI